MWKVRLQPVYVEVDGRQVRKIQYADNEAVAIMIMFLKLKNNVLC